MKTKSECSCEPNMRELCMHCDNEKKQTQRAENNELCMIGYPHNSSNRCQDPIKLKAKNRTGKEARTGEVLFRTGNRITPPAARVKQSDWLRLKLPLRTCPGALKFTFHQTVYKIQIRLLSHCNRTSRAIEFRSDMGQRLKREVLLLPI